MNKKLVFSIAFIAVFIMLSIWAFTVSNSIIGDTSFDSGSTSIEQQGEEITLRELIITETKDGKKFWEVYADSGYYAKTTEAAILKNITGNFYQDGKVVLSLTAPKATYDSETKEICLMDGAEAVSEQDIYINADEIHWAGSNDRIKAIGNVKIIREGQVMTVSDSSSFDTQFTSLEISGDAHTYVYTLE